MWQGGYVQALPSVEAVRLAFADCKLPGVRHCLAVGWASQTPSVWNCGCLDQACDSLLLRRQFLNEFVNEALVPHDGTQTPLEKFRKEGGPASLCTHLADAVTTVSGEYTVYYHITDTPGY